MTLRALLDVATVIDGDGNWTKANGYEFDDLACGRTHGTADVCNPPTITVTDQPAATGFKAAPFVHHAQQEFGVRCAHEDAEAALTQAMRDAAEYIIGRQFWSGDVEDWVGATEGVYLEHADVETVAAATNVPASIAAALTAAYAAHPELTPTVHLGLTASYALPPGFTSEHPRVTFVEGIGYPADGIAVTGPVTVHLGTIETISATSHNVNRLYISGTRLAAVEFGPCSAVRVA
jgi:hypothetical protein